MAAPCDEYPLLIMMGYYRWPGGDVNNRENRSRRSYPDKKPRRTGKKTIDFPFR
jgi:hypothetical protein